MTDSSLLLGEPFEVPAQKPRFGKKAAVCLALIIGLGLAAMLSMPARTADDGYDWVDMSVYLQGGKAAQRLGASARPKMPMPSSCAAMQKQYGICNTATEKLTMSYMQAQDAGKQLPTFSLRDFRAHALMGTAIEPGGKPVGPMRTANEVKAQMPGITAPLGFFDPLGLSTDISVGKLLWYREAEIKHGRIGMLATLGIVVGENYHPLFGGNANLPTYEMLPFKQVGFEGFWAIALFCMAWPELLGFLWLPGPNMSDEEFYSAKNTVGLNNKIYPLKCDPLDIAPRDPMALKEMQTKEINNGRLAMLAAAGILAQEMVEKKQIFQGAFR